MDTAKMCTTHKTCELSTYMCVCAHGHECLYVCLDESMWYVYVCTHACTHAHGQKEEETPVGQRAFSQISLCQGWPRLLTPLCTESHHGPGAGGLCPFHR